MTKFEVPESVETLDIQHEEYIEQALGIIGKLLAEIQLGIEKSLKNGLKAPVSSKLAAISSPSLLTVYLQPEDGAAEKEREDARKKYEQLQSDYQQLRDQLEAFAREKAGAPDTSDQLTRAQRRIRNLEKKVRELEARCNLYEAHGDQPADVQALNNQIATLTQQNAELNTNAARYRSLLLQAMGPKEQEPVIDNELRRMFGALFQLTMSIRRNLDLSRKPEAQEGRRRTERLARLREIWDMNLHQNEIGMRVEAAIFEFLNDEILLKPAFGLDDEDRGASIEQGLVDFEERVNEYPEGNGNLHGRGEGDINEWRRLTFMCAKRIRSRPGGAVTKINNFARDLGDLLEPLVQENGGGDDGNKRRLRGRVLELCKLTFEFSQLLRAEPGPGEFEIYTPEPGSTVREEFMEPMAGEGGYPENAVGTVAFTLFGGLMISSPGDDEPTPIEPAKVISKVVEHR
ncbi:hypothetical protein NHQ30_002618 [Ciborinia camelliae]|nr:hypothetical protein NHQ30_002618 [Ciborinia camelliae]